MHASADLPVPPRAPFRFSSWRCIEAGKLAVSCRSAVSPWISNRNSVPRAMPPRTSNKTTATSPTASIDDELVGRGLGDDFAGALEQDTVALADHKGGKLTEFAEAMAQCVNRVAAGDL